MLCPIVLIRRITTTVVGRNDLDYHLRNVGFRTKRDCKFTPKVVAVQLPSLLVFTNAYFFSDSTIFLRTVFFFFRTCCLLTKIFVGDLTVGEEALRRSTTVTPLLNDHCFHVFDPQGQWGMCH